MDEHSEARERAASMFAAVLDAIAVLRDHGHAVAWLSQPQPELDGRSIAEMLAGTINDVRLAVAFVARAAGW